MSYLSLSGLVRSVIHTDASLDRESGEERPERWQVQIEVEEVTPSGDSRFDIKTLKTDRPELFEPMVGKRCQVPVGVFARKDSIVYYLPKARGKAAPAAPREVS
jgi:hypothetical protein